MPHSDESTRLIAAAEKPVEQFGAWRMFDAAANRAFEGLRVVEDVVRFIWDDALLTAEWKQLRHELAATVAACSPGMNRLAARQTPTDVGTAISTAAESQRADVAALLAANGERIKQSLRTLEESAKLLAAGGTVPPEVPSSNAAARFEQLRYRVYALEAATRLVAGNRKRLDAVWLYWITDAADILAAPERIAAILAAGVDAVQLRAKGLADRELLARAVALRRVARDNDCLFLVNDRPDIAALARADGVHVGQDELTVADARRIMGPDALVGVSTHSLEQVRQAVLDGASYLGVGPTFPGTTKQFDAYPGLEFVAEAAGATTLPWFAIGGIREENLPQVLAAGATRVAVAGAITGPDSVCAFVGRTCSLSGPP